MAIKKFEDWIVLQENEGAGPNQMSPGGQTQMAGNPGWGGRRLLPDYAALANATGDEQQEESELDDLSSQMQRILGRLIPLVKKMKNKQMGLTLLHAIGQAVQETLNVSDTAAKNAVVGNGPQFNAAPHTPPQQGMQQGTPQV